MTLSPESSQPEIKPNNADLVMNKLLGCAYMTFLSSFYWTLFSKFDAVTEVFKQIVRVTARINNENKTASPSWRKVS